MRVAIVFSEEIQSLIKPIVDARRQLFDEGITLGANLPRPDVRIIDNRLAVKELKENNGKLLIPSLVYEWADSAGIDSHSETRELLAHSDTLLWLKINKFKDPSLFNEPTIAGRLHFRFLNECSKFTIPSATPSINPVPITPEMVSKIRLLPAGIFDRFKPFREATVNVQPKRPIDVSFAGLVDYSIRDHDYWDENFARTKDDPSPTTRFFNDVHRRAAVTELTKLRHLRIVLGLNRVLQPDLYQAVLLRSSISVSPWGFGEYAWRDYESIFAGCILVKPDTDHVESFAPNIYQSGKYYYKCAPDFSDLADVIAHIMTHRKEALEIASAARQDLIAETAKEKIGSYYVKLLREAAGNRASEPHHLASALFGANQSFYPPVIVLGKSSSVATRAEAKPHLFPLAASSHERAWLLTEDHSASNTHDLRLVTNEVIGPGLYRLRFLMRAAARSHAVVQIHSRWENSALFHVDLHSAQIAGLEIKGTLLEFVEHPMCIRVDDNWIGGTSILRIVDFLDGCGVVVYAADGKDYKYTGDGRDSLAIGLLDLTRI